MHSSPAFSGQRIETEQDLAVVQFDIGQLTRPAPRGWTSGRIATLLAHYFAANTDAKLMEAVAEDWMQILSEYPAWAISNACRWWMSRENPKKHCKPLPGDIEDRAYAEMERVRVAQIMVGRGVSRPCRAEPPREPRPQPEDVAARRAIAEDVLGRFRRAGGEA